MKFFTDLSLIEDLKKSSLNWRVIYKILRNESSRSFGLLGSGDSQLVAVENEVFRRIYLQNSKEIIVLVKGKRGRPITLQRIAKTGVSSSKAAASTERKRRQSEEQFSLVSFEISFHLKHELKMTPPVFHETNYLI